MAVIKQRLCRKTEDGSYDTIHLETSSDLIVRPNGANLETAITNIEQNGINSNAGTATQLQTPRSIQTNLGSQVAEYFNGSRNITPGVTGVLLAEHGGTGQTNLESLADIMYSINSSKISKLIESKVSSMSGGGPAKPTTIPDVGGTFNWIGYNWVVVHKTTYSAIIAINNSYKLIAPATTRTNIGVDSNGYATYMDYVTIDGFLHVIDSHCNIFAISTGIIYCDYIAKIRGCACFLPTSYEIAGYSHFSTASNRAGGFGSYGWWLYEARDTAIVDWSAINRGNTGGNSASTGMMSVNAAAPCYVDSSGNVSCNVPTTSSSNISNRHFRPFVAIKL